MRKHWNKLLILVVVLFLAWIIVEPVQADFGPPVDYPTSIDELWDKVENREYGWAFSECEIVTVPFISWHQVRAINEAMEKDRPAHEIVINNAALSKILQIGGVAYPKFGTLSISEGALFGLMVQSVLKGDKYFVCNLGGLPILHGSGVQSLVNSIR